MKPPEIDWTPPPKDPDKPADVHYNLDFFVASLNGLLQKIGVTKCTLLGNSLGGAIALGQALAHPETVERLILMAPAVFRVEDALKRLTRALGGPDWRNLLACLPADLTDERLRRSALAAHLAASLELARDGILEISQTSPFGPIYLRRRRS